MATSHYHLMCMLFIEYLVQTHKSYHRVLDLWRQKRTSKSGVRMMRESERGPSSSKHTAYEKMRDKMYAKAKRFWIFYRGAGTTKSARELMLAVTGDGPTSKADLLHQVLLQEK